MYKEINCTLVILILKSTEEKVVRNYRPISFCTTINKVISKILTTRMRNVLSSIVNQNQATFVHGQHIHDHMMLGYELIQGYTRKGGTPRYMIQIDLQKAYDTWNGNP